MNKPEYIVIHHSFTPDGPAKNWDAICRYLVETNGWRKVGYHYGIELVGATMMVFNGRQEDEEGAHCKEMGMNSKSIGICIIGDFDVVPPSIEHMKTAAAVCQIIAVHYDIPRENLIGHRDAGLMAGYDWKQGQFKTCPGKMFPLGTLRTMVWTPEAL